MIRLEASDTRDSLRIWLLPNRALSWAENRRLIWSYLGVGTVLMLSLVRAGYWPIAGFTLLTLLLLIAATFTTLRRLAWRECIQLTPERIHIQRGRRAAELDHNYPRDSVRLRVHRARTPWQPPGVWLDCGESRWEVGRDLNASERRRLAGLLQTSGIAALRDAGTDHRVA